MLSRFATAAFAVFLFAGLHLATALEPGQPFVFAHYNLRNWLSMGHLVDGAASGSSPKPEREKQAAIDVIVSHHPDILGVVEMGQNADLAEFQKRLKKAGLDYPYTEWVEGIDPDRHVALLSKFPIVARNSTGHVPFDLDGKPEAMQRGILDVTIEPAEGYRLRVIGVHLKSQRDVPEFDQAALRAKEAAMLRDHVEKILAEDPDANILLYGDFNDTKNEFPMRDLLGNSGHARLTDIFLTDAQGDRWTHFWKAADIYSRIDYLIASPGLLHEIDRGKSGVDRSKNWFVASDHRAIYTTIKASDQ